jgi:uncharacterized protein (DUF488 family)
MKSIYTIGYEGSNIFDFISTLKSAGVHTLADVRQVTVSRKKGFSKNGLRELLAENQIAYVHFKELGDPKPGREAARRGDFTDFRRIYGEHISGAAAQSALEDLAKVASKNLTCMMCYERDPRECHRTIVANHLTEYGLCSFDLFVDKREKYEQHPEKLPSHRFGQSIAATEHRLL